MNTKFEFPTNVEYLIYAASGPSIDEAIDELREI